MFIKSASPSFSLCNIFRHNPFLLKMLLLLRLFTGSSKCPKVLMTLNTSLWVSLVIDTNYFNQEVGSILWSLNGCEFISCLHFHDIALVSLVLYSQNWKSFSFCHFFCNMLPLPLWSGVTVVNMASEISSRPSLWLCSPWSLFASPPLVIVVYDLSFM